MKERKLLYLQVVFCLAVLLHNAKANVESAVAGSKTGGIPIEKKDKAPNSGSNVKPPGVSSNSGALAKASTTNLPIETSPPGGPADGTPYKSHGKNFKAKKKAWRTKTGGSATAKKDKASNSGPDIKPPGVTSNSFAKASLINLPTGASPLAGSADQTLYKSHGKGFKAKNKKLPVVKRRSGKPSPGNKRYQAGRTRGKLFPIGRPRIKPKPRGLKKPGIRSKVPSGKFTGSPRIGTRYRVNDSPPKPGEQFKVSGRESDIDYMAGIGPQDDTSDNWSSSGVKVISAAEVKPQLPCHFRKAFSIMVLYKAMAAARKMETQKLPDIKNMNLQKGSMRGISNITNSTLMNHTCSGDTETIKTVMSTTNFELRYMFKTMVMGYPMYGLVLMSSSHVDFSFEATITKQPQPMISVTMEMITKPNSFEFGISGMSMEDPVIDLLGKKMFSLTKPYVDDIYSKVFRSTLTKEVENTNKFFEVR